MKIEELLQSAAFFVNLSGSHTPQYKEDFLTTLKKLVADSQEAAKKPQTKHENAITRSLRVKVRHQRNQIRHLTKANERYKRWWETSFRQGDTFQKELALLRRSLEHYERLIAKFGWFLKHF